MKKNRDNYDWEMNWKEKILDEKDRKKNDIEDNLKNEGEEDSKKDEKKEEK